MLSSLVLQRPCRVLAVIRHLAVLRYQVFLVRAFSCLLVYFSFTRCGFFFYYRVAYFFWGIFSLYCRNTARMCSSHWMCCFLIFSLYVLFCCLRCCVFIILLYVYIWSICCLRFFILFFFSFWLFLVRIVLIVLPIFPFSVNWLCSFIRYRNCVISVSTPSIVSSGHVPCIYFRGVSGVPVGCQDYYTFCCIVGIFLRRLV